jgi:Glycoside-hydrolase family GH114
VAHDGAEAPRDGLRRFVIGLLLAAAAVVAPPVDAGFDYQIGGDYPLPAGVTVVSRDWREGSAPDGAYAVCYVNAFQTQPGERARWPPDLVLTELGDDPGWPAEFAIDISTDRKRVRAARRVGRMVRRCAEKGFEAVEYDNLDSWTRFEGAPFGRADAVAYARRLVRIAHARGLAAAQKNTPQLARRRIGFDFAIAEECGRYRECARYRARFGDHLLAIEYRRRDFRRTCARIGAAVSVVLRDRDVSTPGSRGYRFASC